MIGVERVMSERRSWVVALVVIALANVAVYLLGVLPLSARATATEARAQQAARDVVTATADVAAARRTVEGRLRAHDQLRRFYADVLPDTLEGARHVAYLKMAQMAKGAGLSVNHRTLKTTPVKKSALTRLDMNMALSGDYRSVREFIYAVETAPDFIVIESLSLSQSAQEMANTLTLDVAASTFFRTNRAQ